MTDTTDLLRPLGDAQAALKAATAAIRKSDKAIKGVRSAHTRAEIAEAELAALRGGIREWGADPTNLQNMYAQLSSRTRQWKETKSELAATQALIARAQAECDRIEAAVRANPTSPDFDGAYLAAIRHIRAALAGEEAP
jgi:DNA repair ATPase RecN